MVWKKSNQNSAATYDIKIWKKIFQGRFRKLEVRKDKPKSPMSIGFVLKKFLSIIKKKFENLENIRNFCGQKWTKKGKKNVHALESQLAKVCILKEGIRNQFYCIKQDWCAYWNHGSMLLFFHFPCWCCHSMCKVSFLCWYFQKIRKLQQKLGFFHEFHIIFWIFS